MSLLVPFSLSFSLFLFSSFLSLSLSLLYLYICFHVPLSVFFFSISLSPFFLKTLFYFFIRLFYFSLFPYSYLYVFHFLTLCSLSLSPYSHKERRWQTIFVNGLGVDPIFVYSSYATERERERETKSVFIYFFLVYLKANFVSAHTTQRQRLVLLKHLHNFVSKSH